MTRRRGSVMAVAALLASAATVAASATSRQPARASGSRSADTLSSSERRTAGGWIWLTTDSGMRHLVTRVRPWGETSGTVHASDARVFPWDAARDGGALLVVESRDGHGAHHERVLVQRAADAGSDARPLTVWSGRMRNPSWSPDGRWVALETDAYSFGDVVRVDLATRRMTRLTRGTAGSYEPAVSPDGGQIAFVSSRSGNAEVYVMGADGGGVRRLTASPRDSWSPRWSPDGSRLAFVSNRSGRDRVYVVRADGTELVPLTGAAGAHARPGTRRFEGESAPAWSPDGGAIAFLARESAGRTRVWVTHAQGGEPHPVSPASTDAAHVAWSPDGRLLAVGAGTEEEGGVFVVRGDGAGWTRVGPAGSWLPRWSR